MKKIKQVKVSHQCIGCGTCEIQCKDVFQIVPRAKSEVVNKDFEAHSEAVVNAFHACPVQGIEIQSDDPSLQTLWRPATIIATSMLTETVMDVTIRTTEFEFKAGQYVTLRFVDFEGPFNRAYSVVAEDNDVITLVVTILPDGRAGDFLKSCQMPCEVMLTEPRGDFFLQQTDNPKTFIATGTGLAPIIPMIEQSPDIPKILYFGVRKEEDLFYLDRLSTVPNLEIKTCLDCAGDDWTGLRGRVTEIFEKDPLKPETEIYTCGSEPMMQGVEAILKKKKHSQDLFHRESFAADLPDLNEGSSALRIWVRNTHVYASLLLCVLFLFFGITGFMANRPKLFNSDATRTLPRNITLDKNELIGFMKSRLPESASVTNFSNDDGEITLEFANSGKEKYAIAISAEERTYGITEHKSLPPSIDLNDEAAVAKTLALGYPGTLDLDSLESDEESIAFTLTSVWQEVSVMVDKTAKTYEVNEIRSPWVTALTDLHRGKNAGPLQKLFIDASGIIMVLVTLTGILFALQSRLKRTRVIASILLAGSTILAILMLVNR